MPFVHTSLLGAILVGSVAGTACAQVSILSVDRSFSANACVHAPSLYPNWCESDSGSNALPGLWTGGATFGNSAAGDIGYASSIAIGSQQSSVTSDLISIMGDARVEVDSDGICSATGTAKTFLSASFVLYSPTRAVLSGYTNVSIGGTAFLLSLQQLDGPFGYIQSDGYDAEFNLEAGEYQYTATATASGSCSGECSHKQWLGWYSELRFLPLACPADFNGDTVVDDGDFVIFVAAYNDLLCPEPPASCPADLNHDGLVEDTDFTFFAVAYNELVCP